MFNIKINSKKKVPSLNKSDESSGNKIKSILSKLNINNVLKKTKLVKLLSFRKKSNSEKDVNSQDFALSVQPDVNESDHSINNIKLLNPPKKLLFFGNASVKSQYNIAITTAVLFFILGIGSTYFTSLMNSHFNDVRIKEKSLITYLQKLDNDATESSTGDGQSFIQAENAQYDISYIISELAPYADADKINKEQLPIIDHNLNWDKKVWLELFAKSVDLTQQIVMVQKLQDLYSSILSTQPQFGSMNAVSNKLKNIAEEIYTLRRSLIDSNSSANEKNTAFYDSIKNIKKASEHFISSDASLLDLSAIEQEINTARSNFPADVNPSMYDVTSRLSELIAKDLKDTTNIAAANWIYLNQDLSIKTSFASERTIKTISLLSEEIKTPYVLDSLWALSGLFLLLGFGSIFALFLINAKSAEISAFDAMVSANSARKEQQETDDVVISIMHELRPISKGDLIKRITVTEHVTGSIADRINLTIDSIQETLEQVKTSTKAAEISIGDIFKQAEHSQEITTTVSKQALASREASEAGSEAVNMAVERTQKQRVSMQEVAKRVKHLGEVAQSITRVTDLIEEVTGKTEVLAINTSLKAADAGEEGSAFRVIAEEIRKLTNDTKRSLADISSAVQSMQGETQSVIQTVESVTAEVVDSAKYWDGAMNSLLAIKDYAREVDVLMQSVKLTSEMQTKSASDAVEIMAQLTQSTTKFRTKESEVLSKND